MCEQRVAFRDPRDQSKWRTVDEGDLECPGGEFEIPYGSVVPRKSEVANLLVPTCLAASHLGYGAYRLESPCVDLPNDVRHPSNVYSLELMCHVCSPEQVHGHWALSRSCRSTRSLG